MAKSNRDKLLINLAGTVVLIVAAFSLYEISQEINDPLVRVLVAIQIMGFLILIAPYFK